MRWATAATVLLAAAATAAAATNPDTRFRPGANHHLGDDSFEARHGRAPAAGDTEHDRMKVHLEHARALLASRPATRPDLAARRTQLLGFLGDYIAKGITPANTHLPWRTAVFIDDAGAICAVGYLIERSAGRALPEKIAATHRYDFLEDIASAMPEVRSWVESSGFTLEELASIQPAYSSPNVDQWRTWDLAKHAPPDGAFSQEVRGRTIEGTFLKKALQGTWTVARGETIVGTGAFTRGNGTWRSFYPDGKAKLAEGPYVDNAAHGAWTLYHPSGNVAATGAFARGKRTGRWQFFNDTADKKLLAEGAFDGGGNVTGSWNHYDAAGALLARTYQESGNRIDVVPAADGIVHQIHQWSYGADGPLDNYLQELERLSLGGEQIYVHTAGFRSIPSSDDTDPSPTLIFDPGGNRLAKTGDGSWTSANCHWSQKRIGIARAGELAWLHAMLYSESAAKAITYVDVEGWAHPSRHIVRDPGPVCDAAVAVPAARAAVLDKLIAPREALRAASPTFVRELVLGEDNLDGVIETESDAEPAPDSNEAISKDLRRTLTAYTLRHIEWPHIDGRFDRVFKTMPARLAWEWHSSEPEADGTNPLHNEQEELCARGKKSSCD